MLPSFDDLKWLQKLALYGMAEFESNPLNDRVIHLLGPRLV